MRSYYLYVRYPAFRLALWIYFHAKSILLHHQFQWLHGILWPDCSGIYLISRPPVNTSIHLDWWTLSTAFPLSSVLRGEDTKSSKNGRHKHKITGWGNARGKEREGDWTHLTADFDERYTVGAHKWIKRERLF